MYCELFLHIYNLLSITNLLKTHFSDKQQKKTTLGPNLSSLTDMKNKTKTSSSPSYDTDAQLYHL